MSVSRLAEMIGDALANRIPGRIRVIGEISNLSQRQHWFFSLKDEGAIVRCVAWASRARGFGFDAADGLEVIATGTVQHYAPQGQTQLYVEKLEPVGVGALDLRFRALCEELRRLGYFDTERKRPLPWFPRNVAVVTSATGAALQDVLATMRRRCPAVGVVIVDTLVQGPRAVNDIVAALQAVAAHHHRLDIDAVIITRGGGSLEDLWCFNERPVADAILHMPIPTVAAIGHETDTTIAELVADLRCATPTQAAMRLTPDRIELAAQMDQRDRRLQSQVRYLCRLARERLGRLTAKLEDPQRRLARVRDRIDATDRQLHRVIETRLLRCRARVESLATEIERVGPHRITSRRREQLTLVTCRLTHCVDLYMSERRIQLGTGRRALAEAVADCRRRRSSRLDLCRARLRGLDPRRVLSRGFSITQTTDGRVVRSVRDVHQTQGLQTQITDGVIHSTVTEVRGSAQSHPEVRRPRKQKQMGRPRPSQLELFRPSE